MSAKVKQKTSSAPNGHAQGKVAVENDGFAAKMRTEHNQALTANRRFGNFKRGK